MQNKKQHSGNFKFNVVLETFKRDNVIQVAREHNLNNNQVSTWRRQFLDNGHQVFDHSIDKETTRLKKKTKDLEQIIGKKEVELNLLKNFSEFYESNG